MLLDGLVYWMLLVEGHEPWATLLRAHRGRVVEPLCFWNFAFGTLEYDAGNYVLMSSAVIELGLAV